MIENDKKELTEKEAALGYALMVNRLDATKFIEFLDKDVVYESAWVNSDLRGKEKVADYFKMKMKSIRDCLDEEPEMKVTAELVVASPADVKPEDRPGFAFHPVDSTDPTSFEVRYFDERPCVLITQGEEEAVVVFKVRGPYITGINLVQRDYFTYRPFTNKKKKKKIEEVISDLPASYAAWLYKGCLDLYDPKEIIKLLAPNVEYESIMEGKRIKGKDLIGLFLTQKWKDYKLKASEDPVWRVKAKLAIAWPVDASEVEWPVYSYDDLSSLQKANVVVNFVDITPCVTIDMHGEKYIAFFKVTGQYIKKISIEDCRSFVTITIAAAPLQW